MRGDGPMMLRCSTLNTSIRPHARGAPATMKLGDNLVASRITTVARTDRQAFFYLQDWAEQELEVTVRPMKTG